MTSINKFSVITPCFNSEKYIEETIQSIIYQRAVINKRAELEYIICDGGSTDNTLKIIRKYAETHKLIVISEKDEGMYHALTKGIKIVSGNICSYLNAGDFYGSSAFDVVLDIMEKNDVKWLTGINTYYNERSQFISFKVPFKYRRSFIQAGIYGTILPYIQQESTFWSAELYKSVDLERLKSFKMAGDYYLWTSFSKHYKLYIVQSYLGGFKTHNGQLSENMKLYFKEMKQIVNPIFFLKIFAYLEYFIWTLPSGVKKKLNKKGFFRYHIGKGVWN